MEKNEHDGPKEAIVDNYPSDGHHDEEVGIINKADPLKKDLQGRHMQMIAIGKLCAPSELSRFELSQFELHSLGLA